MSICEKVSYPHLISRFNAPSFSFNRGSVKATLISDSYSFFVSLLLTAIFLAIVHNVNCTSNLRLGSCLQLYLRDPVFIRHRSYNRKHIDSTYKNRARDMDRTSYCS